MILLNFQSTIDIHVFYMLFLAKKVRASTGLALIQQWEISLISTQQPLMTLPPSPRHLLLILLTTCRTKVSDRKLLDILILIQQQEKSHVVNSRHIYKPLTLPPSHPPLSTTKKLWRKGLSHNLFEPSSGSISILMCNPLTLERLRGRGEMDPPP